MKTSDVLSYYGTQTAIAAALRIYQSGVARWKEYPPSLRQLQIESLTGGALKAEKTILPKKQRATNMVTA